MDFDLKYFYEDKLSQIFLYITYNCSFSCKHCLIGDRKNDFYNMDDLSTIFETIKKNGGGKVTLLGGEPTEHLQLMEIIKLAKLLDFEVVLDTCGSFPGSFFSDSRFRLIDTVCFSVDGHNCLVHDAIRKQNSFNNVMRHVALAKKHGMNIKFTHTVNKANIDFVTDMIAFSVGLEIDELNFHVATYNGRAKYESGSGILSPKEWFIAYRKIRHFLYENDNTNNTILRIPPRYCTHNELVQRFSDHRCIGCVKDRMLILPQDKSKGDVGGPLYVCGLLIGEKATIGWNVDGEFVFNATSQGEFAKYYAGGVPSVNGIQICPIISQDIKNMNYLNNNSLLPMCISYKPLIFKRI